MAPKKPKVTNASSSSSNTSCKFVNEEAWASYVHAKINRGSIKVRVFAFTKLHSCIPNQIFNQVWEKLFAQPKAAVVPVVAVE